MTPSRPFIERPVATSLLMLAIVLAGLVGFRFLPLSALPQVDYPTIQVQTLYPGASPEVMAHTVTGPLENQFGQMSGLARMSSTSAERAAVPSREGKGVPAQGMGAPATPAPRAGERTGMGTPGTAVPRDTDAGPRERAPGERGTGRGASRTQDAPAQPAK